MEAELQRDNKDSSVPKRFLRLQASARYAQLNEYLPILLEKGYLENYTTIKHRKARKVLKTSELREDFIRTFRSLDV